MTFAELFDSAAEPDQPAIHRHRHLAHRPAHSRTWVCLAEWVLGGWSRTLRAATLLVLAVILVATVLGSYGIAATAGLLALLGVLPTSRRPTLA